MKGMHVHHRILVSEGGTNDPANLYVCTPEYHAKVWHDDDFFVLAAEKGGHANTTAQAEGRSRGGKALCPPQTREAARKTGLSNRGKKYPRNGKSQNGAPKTNSQKWQCLVTGKVSAPGPLSNYQKKLGIDTSLRERIS